MTVGTKTEENEELIKDNHDWEDEDSVVRNLTCILVTGIQDPVRDEVSDTLPTPKHTLSPPPSYMPQPPSLLTPQPPVVVSCLISWSPASRTHSYTRSMIQPSGHLPELGGGGGDVKMPCFKVCRGYKLLYVSRLLLIILMCLES